MPTGNPKSGEIYLLHHPLFRNSTHPHPVLVIRVDGPTATVNFMSSEASLSRAGKDFAIDEFDPEFFHTGLKKTSYLILEGALDVPIGSLHDYWGELPNGELRKRICDWWGETI
jgi:hypothetical protein